MKLETKKARLILTSSYNKDTIAACKTMGMKWNPKTKTWSIADNLLNRKCLYRIFPILRSSESSPEGSSEAKTQHHIDLPSYLMKHQKNAVQIASEQDRFGFFYDAGTGKTLLSLYIHKLHKVKTLLVCPLSLIEGAWMEDIAKFTPEIKAVNLWKIRKLHPRKMQEALESDFCIINFESFKTEYDKLVKAGFEMLTIDESQKCKEPRSKISKILGKFSETVKYCYLLSGTPAPNGIHEYFTQIRMIDPLIWGKSFYKWRSKYFYSTGYGGYTWLINDENKKKLMADIAMVSEAIRKEDVLDLPETTDNKRIFQLSKIETARYREMESDLCAMIDEETSITAPMAAAKIMKLRQISSGFLLDEGQVYEFGKSKLNELKQLIDEIGNRQIIIWTQFIHEAAQITSMLTQKKKTYGVCNGTVSQVEKEINLTNFKAGMLQYLVAHPKTIAHGVTLTNCTDMIYYSNSYSYEELYQSRARIHRKGQKNICSYYFLLAAGTVDLIILSALGRKEKTDRAIMEYLKRG